MTYDEVKNAPLNVLVGYLASLYVDVECTCECKWESWAYMADMNDDVNQCKERAESKEKSCKEGLYGDNYDTCPQRLAYERVMEAVKQYLFKRDERGDE